MKKQITSFALLLGAVIYSQQIDTQMRDNAGSYGANFKSGFFQTQYPVNYPTTASNEWWHLLDVRHTNVDNNYAMQFAGAFGDQNLWFRKTANNGSASWSKVILQDPNGRVGIGENSSFEKFYIQGGHETSTALIHANNGSQPHAFLTFWASEPASSYTGVGIGNNIRNYSNSQSFARIGNDQGGSYMRLLDNEINFNLVSPTGVKQQTLTLAGNGSIGVGTSNPEKKLEVFNSAANGHLRLSTNDVANADMSRIDIDFHISNRNQTIARIASRYDNSNDGGYGALRFLTLNAGQMKERLTISPSGKIGIGQIYPQNELDVNGVIHAKEVKVDLNGWADYVFMPDYTLLSLDDVERHIKEKGHLPNIPSEKEVLQNGVNLGESQKLLLQKIEELMLYTIEQNKQLKIQAEKIEKLEQALITQKTK